MPYFSDEEAGPVPQTRTEMTRRAWGAIAALIDVRIDDGSFGAQYPETCPDGTATCGTDRVVFWRTMAAHIPCLPDDTPEMVLDEDDPPSMAVVMDIIQFCYAAVGKPRQLEYHGFHRHHHLGFDIELGREEFRDEINTIFGRNGLAFTLTADGRIRRLAPPLLREELGRAMFATGDGELDELLETARRKFLDPDEDARRDGLEKLWDAWERLKTIDNPDKKAGVAVLLDGTAGSASQKFRQVLETEAQELTDVGNKLRIRHHETDRERIAQSNHVDYLFHRMFALIRLILRATGRDG